MKIAMLNTFDVGGGAARSSYRLHKGLRNLGVDSSFITQTKKKDDTTVFCGTTKYDKVLALLRPIIDAIPMKLYFGRDKSQAFSSAFVPVRKLVKREIAKADLLHLHWAVHGFFSIEDLAKVNKPIVWTLHDSWAFTGGCHLPGDCTRYMDKCGMCPHLGSQLQHDLTRLNWKRKARVWRDLELTIVTPSKWLAECARSSALFANKRVEVIPNGIDTSVFKPIDKITSRQILGLPEDVQIILFGAMGANTHENKGLHLMQDSLRELSLDQNDKEYLFVVFGAEQPHDKPEFGMKTRYMGTLTDDAALTVLYSSADVMVVPSKTENLPNTVMESMACGTPVVAFRIGGIPDLISHKVNGYLANPFDTSDLAKGIKWITNSDGDYEGISEKCRDKVLNEYAIEIISEQHKKLYSELLVK